MSLPELGATFQSPLLANLLQEAIQGQSGSTGSSFQFRGNTGSSPSKSSSDKTESFSLTYPEHNLYSRGNLYGADLNDEKYINSAIDRYIELGGTISEDGVPKGKLLDESLRQEYAGLQDVIKYWHRDSPVLNPDAKKEVLLDDLLKGETTDEYFPEVVDQYEKRGRRSYENDIIVTEQNQAAIIADINKKEGSNLTKEDLPIGTAIPDTKGTPGGISYKDVYGTSKNIHGHDAYWVGTGNEIPLISEIGEELPETTHKGYFKDFDKKWAFLPPDELRDFKDYDAEFYEDAGHGKVIGTSPLGTILSEGIYLGGQGNEPIRLTGDIEKDKEIAENIDWVNQEDWDASRKFVPWGELEAYLASEEGQERYGDFDYGSNLLAQSGIKYGGSRGEALSTPDLVDLEDIVQRGDFTPSGLLNEAAIQKKYAGQDYYRQLKRLGYE
jgi:hypothetical protein